MCLQEFVKIEFRGLPGGSSDAGGLNPCLERDRWENGFVL